jgi:hypothetical protein
MDEDDERCVHCKRRIQFGWPVKDEWAHASGSRYCQTANGFTATPLQVATPTYYPDGAVL